jgi:hypothetical protein
LLSAPSLNTSELKLVMALARRKHVGAGDTYVRQLHHRS